jgi:hypothetical protein
MQQTGARWVDRPAQALKCCLGCSEHALKTVSTVHGLPALLPPVCVVPPSAAAAVGVLQSLTTGRQSRGQKVSSSKQSAAAASEQEMGRDAGATKQQKKQVL